MSVFDERSGPVSEPEGYEFRDARSASHDCSPSSLFIDKGIRQ